MPRREDNRRPPGGVAGAVLADRDAAADQVVFGCRGLEPDAGERAADGAPGKPGRAHLLQRRQQVRLVAAVFVEAGAAWIPVRAVAHRREVVVEADLEDAPFLRAGGRRLRGSRAGGKQRGRYAERDPEAPCRAPFLDHCSPPWRRSAFRCRVNRHLNRPAMRPCIEGDCMKISVRGISVSRPARHRLPSAGTGRLARPLPFRMQICQVFHQRVGSLWIAAAPVLTIRTLDAIRRLECRNLFLPRHNLLQPELGRACGLSPRAAASLRRPTLFERQSGHERS